MGHTDAAKKFGVLVVVMALCALFVVGCFGPNYKLDRDKSLSTSWGTVLQYKVDNGWSERDSAYSSEDSASVSYESDDGNDSLFLNISVDNPSGSLRKYDSDSTYGDWLDSKEEYYTQSAEEQAAWYRENMSDYLSENPTLGDANYYPDFKDYSMSELGSIDVDGTSFRLYKMEYTISYTDAAYANAKEKYPDSDIEQSRKEELFFAIVKDGLHDAEIATTNEKLLKDFMGTMQIKW